MALPTSRQQFENMLENDCKTKSMKATTMIATNRSKRGKNLPSGIPVLRTTTPEPGQDKQSSRTPEFDQISNFIRKVIRYILQLFNIG